MRRLIRHLCIFFFFVALGAPIFLFGLGVRDRVALTGVTTPVRARVSMRELASWRTGDAQLFIESTFNQRFPFRGFFVKTDSELTRRFFGEISQKTNTKLVLGAEGYLYEYPYIEDYLRPRLLPEQLSLFVEKIKRVQDGLEKKGKRFVFVISPSKAGVYPEYIPNRFVGGSSGLPPTHTYDLFVSLLEANGVHYVDGHQILLELKNEGIPPMTKGGTHWNYYGACIVTRSLLPIIDPNIAKKDIASWCDPVTIDQKSFGTDRDLLDLSNVWDIRPFVSETPHPYLPTTLRGSTPKPRPLFLGSSFTWTILGILHGRAIDSYDFLYYYGQVHRADGEHTGVRPDQVLSRGEYDVVVLEQNESALNYEAYQSLKDFLRFTESL